MAAAAAGAERRTEESLMGALMILHEGAVRLQTIRREAAAAGPASPVGCRVRPSTYSRKTFSAFIHTPSIFSPLATQILK